jgi:hypothetical protein
MEVIMANLVDYVKWRGDLSFEISPFNEIDNAVFSLLSYIDLKDLQTEINSTGISIKDVCKYLIAGGYQYGYMSEITLDFLNELLSSKRFGNVMIVDYVDLYHEKKYQFSSTGYLYKENNIYLAFRGTDDSIIAWKEDFMMSFSVIPAQKFALSFLKKVFSNHPDAKFIVGGHSKGGNLALYSSAMCDKSLQDRIITIYNNDGPDLCEEVINNDVMNAIERKLIKIVPEFCIVGMIFNSTKNLKVVKSDNIAFLQHDILNWNYLGISFEPISDVTKEANKFNNLLDKVLEHTDLDKRREYVNNFFDKIIDAGTTRLPWGKKNNS